ncbi:MAG: hypothetical protein Q9217_003399 [Psora testacea]
MAKRSTGLDEDSPHAKRRKLMGDPAPTQTDIEIHNPNDLRTLLAFEQDLGPHAKQKIQTFKAFLNAIKYGTESVDQLTKRAILLEFLQSGGPSNGRLKDYGVTGLLQSWHFAVQANSESFCSSIAACFALLLKAISSLLEFRDCGNTICRILLHDDQLKLLNHGLSASRHKEHLIDPCLRLLTEVVLFDGGRAAKIVYRQRETTFQRLDAFLSMRRFPQTESDANKGRPSVREIALRYLFANLRLQGRDAKSHLLNNTRIAHSLLQNIADDPARTVHEILTSLRRDILEDTGLSASSKTHFFNEWTLGHLAKLYDYDEVTRTRIDGSVKHAVHAYLTFLCCSPRHGILTTSCSADPIGTYAEAKFVSGNEDPSELSGTARSLKQRKSISAFLKTLRPYANILHGDLILECFRKVPSLVDDYFSGKTSFSFDPKLTATWVGYSRFLLATIQLPIPKMPRQISHEQNAPIKTLINGILPQPLTEKVLTRCLNQSSLLVTFLSVRLLNAAFDKFSKTIGMLLYEQQDECGRATEDSERLIQNLVAEFCSRCPEMKHIIGQFRRCPRDNITFSEAIARLLDLYYETIPLVALEEKLDISAALSLTLKDLDPLHRRHDYNRLKKLELDHLLEVAVRSPHMQWWHRPEESRLTPFTTLLKMHVCSATDHQTVQIPHILETIGRESGVFRSDCHFPALDILALSLRTAQDGDHWEVYDFLDNSLTRLTKKSVMYYELMSDLMAATTTGDSTVRSNIDLLLVALAEQWPHLTQSKPFFVISDVAAWLSAYMHLLEHTHSSPDILRVLREHLESAMTDPRCRAIFDRTLRQPLNPGLRSQLDAALQPRGDSTEDFWTGPMVTEAIKPSEALIPSTAPPERDDHPELYLWTREGAQDAIADGTIGDLSVCLCSQHEAIRKETLMNIHSFMSGLKACGFNERRQIYLLLGELAETAAVIVAEQPLPYFVGALAAALLSVLADPLHFMYTKASKFLNKGPQWDVAKLPSYWVAQVMLHEPTDNEGHYQEIQWLLNVLIDGLRTPVDMEIYRRSNILERLLSMSASPTLPNACFEKVVDLLFRCTYVDGSTTLITRCGLLSWVGSHLTWKEGHGRERLKVLAMRVYETSEKSRANNWSDDEFEAVVHNLQEYQSI